MEVIVGLCGLYILWVLYMATFRTKDFMALMAQENQRKARQAAAFGKAAKVGTHIGFGIAKMFMRR
jgi:hypothetical protein